MAARKKISKDAIVEVRSAVGTASEIADRFGISVSNVWRIKRGIMGRRVPYTPTVDPTPSRGNSGEWLGRKLTRDQHEAIRCDSRRGSQAAREVGEQHGVTPARVLEIWSEVDFEKAKATYDKLPLAKRLLHKLMPRWSQGASARSSRTPM